MKEKVVSVEIELQLNEAVVDDSLEVLEALLDGMASRGLVTYAHTYVESKTQTTSDDWVLC